MRPWMRPEAKTELGFIAAELIERSQTIKAQLGKSPNSRGGHKPDAGISSPNMSREMKSVRIYTRPMQAKIEGSDLQAIESEDQS